MMPRSVIRPLAACCCLLAVSALAAGLRQPWLEKDAPARLLVSPLRSAAHTLRLTIPPDLREQTLGLKAVTEDDAPLVCFPLREDGTIVGAEIQVPAGLMPSTSTEYRKSVLPIHLYLLNKPTDEPDRDLRRPVSLWATQARVIARPGDGRGMLEYYRRLRNMTFRTELDNLSSNETLQRLPAYVQEKKELHYHLITYLHNESTRELAFGVLNERNGAWYLCVDREPLFSWGDHQRDEKNYLASPATVLDPGLHRLDLFGILAEGDEVPTLAYREASEADQYQRFSSGELWSPNEALAMVVERQSDVLIPGYYVTALKAYQFTGTNTALAVCRFRDLTFNLYGRDIVNRRIRLGTQTFENPSPFMSVYLPIADKMPLEMSHTDELGFHSTFRTALPLEWPPDETVSIDIQPISLEHLAPAEDPVTLAYSLDCPATFLPSLLQAGKLTITDMDSFGTEIARREEPIPASPFKRFVGFGGFPAEAVTTRIAVTLNGQAVAQPVTIYHLKPTDTPKFTASVDVLRYDDGLAMLRRRDRTQPLPHAPNTPVTRALLVDDYLFLGAHVDDQLYLADWQPAESDLKFKYLPLHGDPLDASSPALSKFVRLQDVLDTQSDAVVWLIGRSEIKAGLSIPDFRSEITYLIEATMGRRLIPVLATMPIAGGYTQEQLRPYALVVMELAAEYDIPVIDLYSASLKRQNIDTFYRMDDNEQWRSATPSAKGRTWLLKQIQQTIETCNDLRKGR